MTNKVVKPVNLAIFVEELKTYKKKIVLMSGSFDLIHAGHIRSLKEARRLGDVLIILLNSDKSIKSYKGRNRPIFNESDRILILSELSCVDYIVLFDELTPKKYFNLIKPDIFCNGEDWGKDFIGRDILEKNGADIVILKRTFRSTSFFIKKILRINKGNKKYVLLSNSSYKELLAKQKYENYKGFEFYVYNNTFLKNISTGKKYSYKNKKGLLDLLLKLARLNKIILNNSYLVSSAKDDLDLTKELNMKGIYFGEKSDAFQHHAQSISELKQIIK